MAKVKAAVMFITDLAKQGWEYVDKFGISVKKMPFAHIEFPTLPSRSQQENWHFNPRTDSIEHKVECSSPGVVNVPALDAVEKWEFELAAVFLHQTILAEVEDGTESS